MATSRDCDAPHLDLWARRKGLGLLGTGDCVHPAWRAELRQALIPAEEGAYVLRDGLRIPDGPDRGAPRFLVTGEIACVYKREGRIRRVHHLIVLPSLEAADALAQRLEKIGSISSDGRPILKLDSRDLLAMVLDAGGELIPAHIWTPHWSMFGAFTGFETLEECFGDLASQIHAVETGLSADPPMFWRVSALDGRTLVSHSDAHSPAKLGREADVLSGERSYPALLQALRTGEGLLGTVEFFPEEGKYHLDGHRDCNVCLTPQEAQALGNICPVCGKPLTVGVAHRVEDLSRRPAGYRPPGAKDFQRLISLTELLSGAGIRGKRRDERYASLLREVGPELYILRHAPLGDIAQAAGPQVSEAVRRLRAGQVSLRAGYDGRYGAVQIF